MCLYPELITNPKYKSSKKNGGNIPPITDIRVTKVPIGCQNCIECRKQKARAWQARLTEDIKHNKNGKFITFTFSDQSITELKELKKTWTQDGSKAKFSIPIEQIDPLEQDNEIATIAIRRFLERWRKKYKKSLRHWAVTELGHQGSENIHIHAIIWTDEPQSTISKIWQYGHTWIGNYTNEETINYIIKYVTKVDEKHKHFKSRILTSPGIGNNYTATFNASKNRFNDRSTNETYRTRSGIKINLPIYWRNKIYTEQDREKLWLYKLDKQERWICGERIKVRNKEEFASYLRLLEWHRKRNTQLGYGSNEKNWDREKYEREIRIIKNNTRIARAKKSQCV